MILAVFQATVQAAIPRADPAATRGLDTVPGGTVGQFYCWSYGYTYDVYHTSMTCWNKKTGHCDASTDINRMNGKRSLCYIGRVEDDGGTGNNSNLTHPEIQDLVLKVACTPHITTSQA